jgi:ATP-dependent Lhr-like helicase
MEQLAGCPLPVGVWNDVLSVRVRGYNLGMLGRLVRAGELEWSGRAVGGGQRGLVFAPHGVALPGESQTGTAVTDPIEHRVLEYLSERGASFLHRIVAGTDRRPSEIAMALWSLIWKGRVTNDVLETAFGGEPRTDRWQGRQRGAPWGGGRWSAVEASGAARSEDETKGLLRTVLHRYGILNRELVGRDGFGLRWADAYPALTRSEWAGDVERGLFVSGLSAPQFASRGAVDRLREGERDGALILINVFDPACIYGDLVPINLPNGERYVVRHHPSNYLILHAGRAILAAENRGERLVPLTDLGHVERREALATLRRLVEGRSRPPAVRVKAWDGRAIVDTPIAADLEMLGFVREDRTMILYRSYDERSST